MRVIPDEDDDERFCRADEVLPAAAVVVGGVVCFLVEPAAPRRCVLLRPPPPDEDAPVRPRRLCRPTGTSEPDDAMAFTCGSENFRFKCSKRPRDSAAAVMDVDDVAI